MSNSSNNKETTTVDRWNKIIIPLLHISVPILFACLGFVFSTLTNHSERIITIEATMHTQEDQTKFNEQLEYRLRIMQVDIRKEFKERQNEILTRLNKRFDKLEEKLDRVIEKQNNPGDG